MRFALEEIKYVCHHLHEAHSVSVFYVNTRGQFAYESPAASIRRSPYYVPLQEQIREHAVNGGQKKIPVFFSINRLHFFRISLQNEEAALGQIVVGPCLDAGLDETQIDYITELMHEFSNVRVLIEFYQSLPVIGPERFRSMSLLVYSLLYQERLDPAQIVETNGEQPPENQQPHAPELEISRERMNLISHTNLSHERVLLDYVRKGRIDKVQDVVRYSLIGEDELGKLSRRSRIRSEKNLMITGVALICRSAIEGGLNEETAFTLSDYYIQQLEEQESLQAISKVMTEAVFAFTERVSKVKEQQYSSTITACQHYISDHLYDDITLEQLAKLTYLSPNYLSSLFKKKVGVPISEYIQRERIDEAKKLLMLTKYKVSDICSWLNFNDQSYFNRVFKKMTGVTPKRYREEGSAGRAAEKREEPKERKPEEQEEPEERKPEKPVSSG